jgi:CRISPR/Cas system Type II protein with McrA/HNH and RuvC-like nuclease domain
MDKVLVLNSDFTPLNVTSLRRGFNLVQKGRAEVLKKGDDIVTTIGNFVRPIIIRLLNFVRFRPNNLSVSRKRLFKRDNFQCGYCGSQKNLTIDHVIPKSRGGSNGWNNLVTCCSRCNSLKGDKTPEDAGMKLRFKPTVPNIFSRVVDENVEKVWNEFDYTFS